MKVQIISFACILKNKFGRIISSTVNRDVLTGDFDNEPQLKALADKMQDLQPGEKRRIALTAAEAYGYYDPELVMIVPRRSLPALNMTGDKAAPVFLELNGQRKAFRVVKASDDEVTLDGNHPLAGQDLVFEIETLSVRDATAEEIYESQTDLLAPLYH